MATYAHLNKTLAKIIANDLHSGINMTWNTAIFKTKYDYIKHIKCVYPCTCLLQAYRMLSKNN